MSWGILEMLGSVTTLILAIPLAYAGAELLLRGDLLLGSGLLGVALVMVVAEQYVTTLSDLPILVASKLVSAVVGSPDEE
jgi:hypothetical protein